MNRVVIFDLNDLICATEALEIFEIVNCQKISIVPELPPYIEGITNLRDLIIPVIDLNKRFHLGSTPITSETKIIITDVNDKKAGFIVNAVRKIIIFQDEDLKTVPETVRSSVNHYLTGILLSDGLIINLIQLNNILNELEINDLPS